MGTIPVRRRVRICSLRRMSGVLTRFSSNGDLLCLVVPLVLQLAPVVDTHTHTHTHTCTEDPLPRLFPSAGPPLDNALARIHAALNGMLIFCKQAWRQGGEAIANLMKQSLAKSSDCTLHYCSLPLSESYQVPARYLPQD